MFSKYGSLFFNIKWKFDKCDQKMYEDMLMVKFEPNGDHFLISEVSYTYLDVLAGMERLNFVMSKNIDDIEIKIV